MSAASSEFSLESKTPSHVPWITMSGGTTADEKVPPPAPPIDIDRKYPDPVPAIISNEIKTQLTNHQKTKLAQIYIGDGLYVTVPERFTFETFANRHPVRHLMFYPVRARDGKVYDALPALESNRHFQLTFDNKLHSEIRAHFQHFIVDNKGLFSNPEHVASKEFVMAAANIKDAGWRKNLFLASEIQTIAHHRDVEIIHDNPGDLPSIAIPHNPKFGPKHRRGIMISAVVMSVMEAFNYNNSLSGMTFYCVYSMFPMGLVISANLHTRVRDCNTILTSMNHCSIPTTFLYGAAGAGVVALDYGINTGILSAMTTAGAASAGVTTVAVIVPVTVGAAVVGTYFYGPQITSYLKDKASTIYTGLQNCAYGVSDLFKACGSKLWCRSQRPPTQDAQPPLADAKVSFLPNPGGSGV